jgi:flagellar biosynthesis/type III secretory pathway protein FliH
VQLNRLHWRDYVSHKNPVASALMARMEIAQEDRPFVKLECLRLMVNLQLNQAKMRLISGFIDTYLELNASEVEIFKREAAKLESGRRKKVMELTTSWMREGIEIGVKQGVKQGQHQEALKIVSRQLNRRISNMPVRLQGRIKKLSVAKLEKLSDALLDFTDVKDLTIWLDNNKS